MIDKVLKWQHPEGGFGGGPGQSAHLLATYASVCSLAVVGRPGPRGGWDEIDRYGTPIYTRVLSYSRLLAKLCTDFSWL